MYKLYNGLQLKIVENQDLYNLFCFPPAKWKLHCFDSYNNENPQGKFFHCVHDKGATAFLNA